MVSQLSEEELQEVYAWVDSVPLSRPKRNLARDFSDGVLLAEVVHHYFPRHVELHNYSPTNNTSQKLYNWGTLNQRVLKRLGMPLPREDCEAAAAADPGAAERVLLFVRGKIARLQQQHAATAAAPQAGGAGAEADNHAQQGSSREEEEHRAGEECAPAAAGSPPRVGAGAKEGKGESSGGGGGARVHISASCSGGDPLAGLDPPIRELLSTNELLEVKVRKLEQLVRLKDAKIAALASRLEGAGLGR